MRDGSQTEGVNFSIDDKNKIAKALSDLGVDYLEGGWPGANTLDTTFFNKPPKLENTILTAAHCFNFEIDEQTGSRLNTVISNRIYTISNYHKNDENFDKINVNTLIMTGEFDIGSTVEMSNELNKIITNSQLKIIKDGKHLCGIECANDVNLSIKNFVEENE